MKIVDNKAVQAQLQKNLKDFMARGEKKLELAAAKYARALVFHGKQRITSVAALRKALAEAETDKKRLELLKEQITIVVVGYGWTEYKTARSSRADRSVGTVADLTAKAELMISQCGKKAKPIEPPVPDSAIKGLRTLGTMSLQASELLVRKQANATELRQRASAQQAAKEQAAEEKRAARLDQHAQAHPEETPVIEVGMHLEILTEITEEVAEDGADGKAVIKKYKQWLPVTVILSAATPGRGKAPTRKTVIYVRLFDSFFLNFSFFLGGRRAPDWYLVKYECDGEEEWLRLKEFNCNSRGSWRIDLDYERDAPEAEVAATALDNSSESEDAETENSSSSQSESHSERESEVGASNEEGDLDGDSS